MNCGGPGSQQAELLNRCVPSACPDALTLRVLVPGCPRLRHPAPPTGIEPVAASLGRQPARTHPAEEQWSGRTASQPPQPPKRHLMHGQARIYCASPLGTPVCGGLAPKKGRDVRSSQRLAVATRCASVAALVSHTSSSRGSAHPASQRNWRRGYPSCTSAQRHPVDPLGLSFILCPLTCSFEAGGAPRAGDLFSKSNRCGRNRTGDGDFGDRCFPD
jgi:hypothetical protein